MKLDFETLFLLSMSAWLLYLCGGELKNRNALTIKPSSSKTFQYYAANGDVLPARK